MIKTKRTDVTWGYAGQVLNIASSAVLLPLVLHFMPTDQLGVWYIVIAVVSLVALLDFGFQGTISVNASYVFSGARILVKEGVPDAIDSGGPSMQLLAELVATVRVVYRVVVALGLVLLLGLGTPYVFAVARGTIGISELSVGWSAIVLSSLLNLYFSYVTGILTGQGKIAEVARVLVVSRIVYLVSTTLFISLGYGIVGLGLAGLFQSATLRFGLFLEFRSLATKIKSQHVARDAMLGLFRVLWFNARKAGLVGLGSFLVLRSSVLLAGTFLAPSQVALLGVTQQVIDIGTKLATTFFGVHLPQLSAAQCEPSRGPLRRIYFRSWVVAILLFVLFAIFTLFFGGSVLSLVRSRTHLIESPLLLIMMVAALLEMNHSMAATAISTGNRIPYVRASVLSGVAILGFSYLSLAVFNYGLPGLVVTSALVQLAYNNWKWPLLLLERLETTPIRFLLGGVREALSPSRGPA